MNDSSLSSNSSKRRNCSTNSTCLYMYNKEKKKTKNTKIEFYLLLLASILIVILAGIQFYRSEKETELISRAEAEIVYSDEISVFRVIKREAIENSYLTQTILYDPSTLVMYAYTSESAHSGTITPMYNADGTLRLYNDKSIDLYH